METSLNGNVAACLDVQVSCAPDPTPDHREILVRLELQLASRDGVAHRLSGAAHLLILVGEGRHETIHLEAVSLFEVAGLVGGVQGRAAPDLSLESLAGAHLGSRGVEILPGFHVEVAAGIHVGAVHPRLALAKPVITGSHLHAGTRIDVGDRHILAGHEGGVSGGADLGGPELHVAAGLHEQGIGAHLCDLGQSRPCARKGLGVHGGGLEGHVPTRAGRDLVALDRALADEVLLGGEVHGAALFRGSQLALVLKVAGVEVQEVVCQNRA